MKHVTSEELHRRIIVNYQERTATHRAMLDGTRPLVSPLSEEWADLSARYSALAAQSDDLYAELTRRETANA